MSIDIDEALSGMDDAVVEDRLPGLEENGRYLLSFRKAKMFKGRRSGLTLGIDYTVVKSSNPRVVVDSHRNTRITALDNPDRQNMQFGRVRQFLGGMHFTDPGSKQKWRSLLDKVCGQPEAFAGFLFCAETGPTTKSDSGFTYIPINFSAPSDEDLDEMPARQRKLYEKINGGA